MRASRHLDYPALSDPGDLGPAALEEILERGELSDWGPLVRAIRRDPGGPLAETILRLCAAHPMYGTSALWTTWIEHLRSRTQQMSLRALREASGLTQAELAQRMGSSQSDVSKLERRDDVRLSTLRAYLGALGGTLMLRVATPALRAELLIGGARQ